MSRLISSSWLLALILALLTGCGDGESETAEGGGEGGGEEPAAAADQIKRIDAEKLPKVVDYVSPQSGVEIAGPEGWNRYPKKAGYLIRYYHMSQTELPRIEVTAGEAPAGFKEVTADNVTEFAEALKNQGRKGVIEPPKPLILGDSAWVRHVRLAKMSGDKVQIQALQTVSDGKLYNVEIIIEGEEAADMKKYKDFGYAVAAGVKFGAAVGDSGKTFQVPMPEQPAPAPMPEAAPANP